MFHDRSLQGLGFTFADCASPACWSAALLSEFPFGYFVLLHIGVGITGVYKELHIHFSQRFRPGRHDVMKSNYDAGGGERRR